MEHISRSASYAASWLAALHDDRRFILAAAKMASSAAAYVIGEPDSREQIDA